MANDQDKTNEDDLDKMLDKILDEVFKDFEDIEEEEDDDVLETSGVDAESGE